MASSATSITPNASFLREVEEASGQKISPCYQCVKCSNGCPVNFAMDFLPHQLLRMIQVGLKEKVLQSSTIWLCASCETCTTRCPNDIDLAGLMDILRQMAVREGVPLGQENILLFHTLFLSAIRARGRLYEVGLIGRYKLRSGAWLQDLALGWEMFRRGKLKLRPSTVQSQEQIRAIFARAAEKGQSTCLPRLNAPQRPGGSRETR
ncbi:MAG TPA: heterodisulfide reductase [Armatimonadetes bacterium]|nr:heterodisulfide reductase [Armatimonadota bacterium]